MNNLLIIGAGGHGHVVKEIAESLNTFDKIDFIDDKSDEAIGKIDELNKFTDDYKNAFVAIGNNEVRKKIQAQVIDLGYSVPTIIHSSAYISPTAKIGVGVLVEPMAIINTNSIIGDGCIISLGTKIDHDIKIGEFCHINLGSIVKAGNSVDALTKVDAGEVIK